MAYSGAYRRSEPETEPVMGEEQVIGEEPAALPRQNRQQRGGFDLSGILKKIEAAGMETDDLLMALILFLMYRESGDIDLLIMLGVMLLT